jgi:hypothetical protein
MFGKHPFGKTVYGTTFKDVNFVPLQSATFCVQCELISTNSKPYCLACGSHALLGLSRVLGGSLRHQQAAHLINDIELLSSEQQLHLVKLLSPTNLRQGYTMRGMPTSVTVTLAFPSDSLNSAITVISLGHCPGTDTCEPGIVFPFSLEKDMVDTIFLLATTSL